jgi:hypothetical protein
VDTVSGSRVRDGGGGTVDVDVEVINDGKAPGIPADVDVGADSDSGTTPPSRLPEPAKPLRGMAT